jgi:hypothetical protein
VADDVDQELHDALDQYQRSGVRALGLGVAAIAIGGAGARLGLLHEVNAYLPLVLGAVAIGVGLVTLTRCARIRRRLRRDGWTQRTCQFDSYGTGRDEKPALLLWAKKTEPEVVLAPSTVTGRWRQLFGCRRVRVIGDPQSRLVAIVPPHTNQVLVFKRPYLGIRRRQLRRIAMGQRRWWPPWS